MGIWLITIWIAGSIEGRLWNPVTGAPVRKADVVVGTTGGVPVKRAISDVNGRYVVQGLAAGEYRVAAGRAGYLPALLEAVVSLGADEARHDVNIAMDMPATVSGHVFDQEGDPVERVRVAAFLSLGETLRKVGESETNDRGEYRIAGLSGGKYLLHSAQMGFYAPVFYPSASQFEGASALNLARGSEARDIDLRVRQGSVGEITGVVHGPAKQLVTVTVARRSKGWVMAALPEATAQVMTEGRFSFPGLDPATHVVTATVLQPLLRIMKDVAVGGALVEVELTLRPLIP